MNHSTIQGSAFVNEQKSAFRRSSLNRLLFLPVTLVLGICQEISTSVAGGLDDGAEITYSRKPNYINIKQVFWAVSEGESKIYSSAGDRPIRGTLLLVCVR
ncbi:hypothetical protein QUA70_21770 [Microcoleus sp. LAD1_D5]|uniref:hypothetical protein n=1 Tax=unclassified Microcoleus TaxID=2642155 RepID=UPI002FD296BB